MVKTSQLLPWFNGKMKGSKTTVDEYEFFMSKGEDAQMEGHVQRNMDHSCQQQENV